MVVDAPKHYPVLLNEIISIITPQHGGTFIDCTFGQGGYTKEILKYKNTQVIALDRDKSVISIANKLEKEFKDRFKFYQIKFSQIDKILKNDVDTIIFDLGISSIQLKNL